MTTIKPFKRSGEPEGAAVEREHSLAAILQRASAPPELSREAKEHLARVDSIAANALHDLEAVTNDIGRLRDEIVLRARMIGEATIRFDELQRKAGQGYATIRNALDLVFGEFHAIPPAEPAREEAALPAPIVTPEPSAPPTAPNEP
jgi:hypothetical protein